LSEYDINIVATATTLISGSVR